MAYVVTKDDLLGLEKLGSFLIDVTNGLDNANHPHHPKAKVGYEISQGDNIYIGCLDGGKIKYAYINTGITSSLRLSTRAGDRRYIMTSSPINHEPISLSFKIDYDVAPPQYPLSYTPEELLGDNVYSGVPPEPSETQPPIGFRLTEVFNDYLNGLSIEAYVDDVKLNIDDVARQGEQLKLTITDGSNIFVNPYIQGGFDPITGAPLDAGYKYDYEVIDGGQSILITVGANVTYSYPFELEAVEVEPEPDPIGFILTNDFNSYLSGLSIEAYSSDVKLYVDDEVIAGDILKLTITDGANIFVNPYSEGGFDPITGAPIDGGYKYDYEVIEDGQSILITTDSDTKYSYDFDLEAVEVEPDPEPEPDPTPIPVSTFNHIYRLTDEAVNEVLSHPFLLPSGAGAGDWLDYNKYLINLFRIPFNVEPYEGASEKIQLKDYSPSIYGYTISSDLLTFDMGTISITGEEDNLLDYANTVAILHLPYFSPINIDLEYVINKTLRIEFIVNVYSNQLAVNIYTSGLSGAIISNAVQLDTKIPFNLDYGDTPTENRNLGISVSNGVITPYLEIMKHEAVLAGGVFTIPVADEGLLTTASGYVEIDNIKLDGELLNDEYDLIINTLQQGVIINV